MCGCGESDSREWLVSKDHGRSPSGSLEVRSEICFEMGSTGSGGAFTGDRVDRLYRIIRESESEDLSPGNSRGSFFAREGSALAISSPSNLTRSFFRCYEGGHWRGGESYSRRGAAEDFAATVAAIVSRARSFNHDLHDAGLHLNDYVEGLRFPLAVAESTVLPDEDDSARCLERACFCSRGATRSRASEADSGKSEEAIATLTSERDDVKSENDKLRDEAEKLRKANEHLRQQAKTFEQESRRSKLEIYRQKRRLQGGVRPTVLNSETLAVIDALRDEVTEWERRALESSDRKRRASSRSTPSFASPAAEIEDTQGTYHASSSQAGTSHLLPGEVEVLYPALLCPLANCPLLCRCQEHILLLLLLLLLIAAAAAAGVVVSAAAGGRGRACVAYFECPAAAAVPRGRRR
ncbi:hypothetical protein Efla_007494 [Eimeria flavescens]